VAELVTPAGWAAPAAGPIRMTAGAGETVRLRFAVEAGTSPAKRQRLAADVTVGGARLGQAADAVVDIV
jgi:hypothetical protein